MIQSSVATAPPPRVAWTVELHNQTAIAFAATQAQARWVTVRGYWEAYGRNSRTWPPVVARRCPGFDRSRLRHESARAYRRDYVEDAPID